MVIYYDMLVTHVDDNELNLTIIDNWNSQVLTVLRPRNIPKVITSSLTLCFQIKTPTNDPIEDDPDSLYGPKKKSEKIEEEKKKEEPEQVFLQLALLSYLLHIS